MDHEIREGKSATQWKQLNREVYARVPHRIFPGGGTHDVTCRSHEVVDLASLTEPGRSTLDSRGIKLAVHHQMRSAEMCSASHMKDELHTAEIVKHEAD